MVPENAGFAGTFRRLEIVSTALKGNPLGDPSVRPVWVYLPPGYLTHSEPGYPAIYVIQGLTGQVDAWWNQSPFRPTVPQLVDDLFKDYSVPRAIVVFVDAMTALGGSQYVNSPATGRYLDYLCDDVVSFIDAEFHTIARADHRAITGKSSGGYGAMTVPMRRPDVFRAFATHAGDALFEYCFLPGIAATARVLRDHYHGAIEEFWHDFHSRPAFSKSWDHDVMNIYCMSACYSARADGSVELPFDPDTGMLRMDVWDRWLEHDPVRMVPAHADALSSMRGIYIDAGRRDEMYLDLGASAFADELKKLGVGHHFELFDGGHRSFEYRYPDAIRYLVTCLSAANDTG